MLSDVYETFSQCLTRLLKEKNINYASLSRWLGHKSKNTLFRVLHDDVGVQRIHKTLDELKGCVKLNLSAEEAGQLERAMEISEIGLHKYIALSEMSRMLRSGNNELTQIKLKYLPGGKDSTMQELIDSISEGEVEILTLNCCWESVTLYFAKLLSEKTTALTDMKQYVIIKDDYAGDIRRINNIVRLFNFNNYMSYSIVDSLLNDDSSALFHQNAILIRSHLSDQSTVEYKIVMHKQDLGFVLVGTTGCYEYWQGFFKQYEPISIPMKSSFPSLATAEDYAAFTRHYSLIEHNTGIYMYKPDICVNFVDTEIVKASLFDGIKEKNIEIPNIRELTSQLYFIQKKRYQNIFTKSHETIGVLSESAMRRFAKTGLQSDHFYAMRPYTVIERIDILRELIEQLIHNPFFELYLLKDENNYAVMEATAYENTGVMFTPAETNYNFAQGHCDVLITQQDYIRMFISFFNDELVKRRSRPIGDTIELFKELVAELETI